MDTETNDNNYPIVHIIEIELPFPIWVTVLVAIATSCCFVCCFICICQQIQRIVRKAQRKEKNTIKYAAIPSYMDDMKARRVQPNHSSSDLEETVEYGRIQYSMEYDIDKSELHVTVYQCTQLTKLQPIRQPDPYVKVYLEPDMKPMYETTHEVNTLNPRFDNTFTFTVPYQMMPTKRIVFVVYDFGNKRKAVRLGQVTMPLDGVDLTQAADCWLDLDKPDHSLEDDLGYLCFSLRYIPAAGQMIVVVLEAKDLFKTYASSEVFVKVTLKVNGRKISKKKTMGKKDTIHPYYNEEFMFDVTPLQIQDTELLIVVAESMNLLSRSHPIGGILLGHGAPITESEHWNTALASPRRAIAQWHSLHSME